MKKVLVIMGSTASGKSNLAINLAKELDGEIISCDSVQVYRPLNIGSAKIKDTQNIPHHLIDVFDLEDNMNVMIFQQMARQKIDEITSRQKLPICVGGTGFYIKALLYDYEFVEHEETKDFSHLSNEVLHERLTKLDPIQAQKIHVNNRQRLLRIFEQMEASGTTRTQLHQQQKQEILYDAKIFYLTTQRETLHERINSRVDEMFKEGLLDEVTKVSENGTNFSYQGLTAIGYKEFEPYFKGEMTLDEVREKIKTHTRQFSKRQMTWFRHQLKGQIIDSLNEVELEQMRKDINQWVNSNEVI